METKIIRKDKFEIRIGLPAHKGGENFTTRLLASHVFSVNPTSEEDDLMADATRKLGINDVISFADDLIDVLKAPTDLNALSRFFESAGELRSSCEKDDSDLEASIGDIKEKIHACKQKIEGQKESMGEEELHCLQSELESEIQKEQQLCQDLRTVVEQMDDLEKKRAYVEERKKLLMIQKKEESRAQSEISMYASVTKVIPNMEDKMGVSGYIVDRDKKKAEKFNFDPIKMSSFEICNSLWKMGDQ